MVDTRFAVSVHILTVLACSKTNLTTSPILARSVRTHPIVVRRLVARLVEHQLVNAFRGKAGGLELARDPKKITLREIYLAATEKTLVAASKKPVQKDCAVSRCIGKIFGEVVTGLEEVSLGYLDTIKLSDLSKKVK